MGSTGCLCFRFRRGTSVCPKHAPGHQRLSGNPEGWISYSYQLATAHFFIGMEPSATALNWSNQLGEAIMADSAGAGLIVEMIDDQIVETMPGTLFLTAYRKRQDVALLASHFMRDDRHAPIARAEFIARSWRISIAKARELGWIK
jgi:hypothetical protein